jgi:hypothetical protein
MKPMPLAGGTGAAYDCYFCAYDMKGDAHLSDPVRTFMAEDASDLRIGEIPPQIYCGKPMEPTPSIFFGDETMPLMLDDEFTITYENNEKPGTATVIVDFVDSVTGVSGRLTADFEIVMASEIFTDVPDDAPYLEALSCLYGMGVMNGTGDKTFSPDAPLTRAMVVKILHELMGAPAPKSLDGFADVSPEHWYASAVNWAKEVGLVKGVDDTHFAPKQNVTREQLSVILARFGTYVGMDVDATVFGNIYRNYQDAALIHDFAFEAIRWACGNGMLTAVSGGNLDPLAPATRAQTAEAIYRLIQM